MPEYGKFFFFGCITTYAVTVYIYQYCRYMLKGRGVVGTCTLYSVICTMLLEHELYFYVISKPDKNIDFS